MANIDYINRRISGKEKEITKLEKKLERIKIAEASGWEKNNPYYYSESDLRYTLNDLERARDALNELILSREAEEERLNSRNVEAILIFLDKWKETAFAFYEPALAEAHKEKIALKEMAQQFSEIPYGTDEHKEFKDCYSKRYLAYREKMNGYYRPLTDEEKKQPRYRYEHQVKVKEGEWEFIRDYYRDSYEASINKLKQAIDEEANRKYDYIIERVNRIVGQITDASALSIGATGELNGTISGTNGSAFVQTIGAGGYNIQCYHFRTLIHEVK